MNTSEGKPISGPKRWLDLLLVLAMLPLIFPLAVLVAVAIKATSPGPVIYWSVRIGANGRVFSMPKFRSMKVGTPALATHLVQDVHLLLTPIGGFLRKSSIDEIPQLWSVLRGDMTLVGPRPALFNQDDLIAQRKAAGVHVLVPGVTGLAQVNGRDDLPIPQKVAFDRTYLREQSLLLDLKIMVLTALKIVRQDDIQH